MALSGKSDVRALEARISALEAAIREQIDIQSRQVGKQRWGRGFVPQIQNVQLMRSDAGLSLSWDPAAIPDLRYYELQYSRKPSFELPSTVKTINPFDFFTAGYGMPGFYFYARVRMVSDERRPGPWTPKLESAPPQKASIAPVSGVLTLPRRPDGIVVGGTSASTIARIDGGWVGRCVTLFFIVNHTVTDSTRLRLVGDFAATVNSSLTLRFMGDPYEWVEISRTGTI